MKEKFLEYCIERVELCTKTVQLATDKGECVGVRMRIIEMAKDELIGAYMFALTLAFDEKDELEAIHNIYNSILWKMEEDI